jgi:hypothetical protein
MDLLAFVDISSNCELVSPNVSELKRARSQRKSALRRLKSRVLAPEATVKAVRNLLNCR